MDVKINIRKDDLKKVILPLEISSNLGHSLRPYQEKAIKRFLYYYDDSNDIYSTDSDNPLKKSRHLLFQMATGSGKTLIMAAIILIMYQKGYRNFWYVVSGNDIITKTRENFLNPFSAKYQFSHKVVIDKEVSINEVENFTGADNDGINIKLSTIQELHNCCGALAVAQENKVSINDFIDNPVVILADEAHHLNASTKSFGEENATWETSINRVLEANIASRLFEFTATMGFDRSEIAKKYEYITLFNYPLKEFSQDRYSKSVLTLETNGDVNNVILHAVLVSQFRKLVAKDTSLLLKPVILFKSKTIKESKEAFESFNTLLDSLTVLEIKKEVSNTISSIDTKNPLNIWQEACGYFDKCDKENGSNYYDILLNGIKRDFDFSEGKVLLHNGESKNKEAQSRLLSTLEEEGNGVRAIFAVDMLGEGWDVLNLFDIVRLYTTRDGKYKGNEYTPGATTVSEAQLIGRGARYFPFVYKDEDKYKRKFDGDLTNPLRVLEEMHYHCPFVPRYIDEITTALVASGIMEDKKIPYKIKMKDAYITGSRKDFQEKLVFENDCIIRKEISKNSILDKETLATLPGMEAKDLIEPKDTLQVLEEKIGGEAIELNNYDRSVKEKNLLNTEGGKKNSKEGGSGGQKKREEITATIGELISDNIIYSAINANLKFAFNKLQEGYPKLESMSQFVEILRKKSIRVKEPESNYERLYIIKQVLKSLEERLYKAQHSIEGTRTFTGYRAEVKFSKEFVRKFGKELRELDLEKDKDIAKETERSEDTIYKIDLQGYDWALYDSLYGSSEEIQFIKWFSDAMMAKVYSPDDKSNKKKGEGSKKTVTYLENEGWENVILARNDKAVKIYATEGENAGEGFEPDFILFMTRGDTEFVFYLEVKGNWAKDANGETFSNEQWKEDFLRALNTIWLTSNFTKEHNKVDNKYWQLAGFPFYNKDKFSNNPKYPDGYKKVFMDILGKIKKEPCPSPTSNAKSF